MKFLVLALCVCAASAASFGGYGSKPYSPYQPARQVAQATAKVVTYPQAAAEEVVINPAKSAYEAAKYVATAPAVAGQAGYQAAKYVATAPAVAGQAAYQAAKYVATAPAVAGQVAYQATDNIASAPVATAKATYDAGYTPVVTSRAGFSGKDGEAAVLRSDNNVNANGFDYIYETQNGISSQVTGSLKNVDGAETIVYKGGYQYTAPDGTPVLVTFVADENGFQPKSNLLPVAPEVPEHVLRSLEYIRTHPQKEQVEKY